MVKGRANAYFFYNAYWAMVSSIIYFAFENFKPLLDKAPINKNERHHRYYNLRSALFLGFFLRRTQVK